MRRAQSSNRFEIVVKAPTLGLYTRVPGEQPDPRAATAASNVRFAEGVAMNAPGYGVLVSNPALPRGVNMLKQITFEMNGKFTTSAVVGTADRIYSIFRYPEGETPVLAPTLPGKAYLCSADDGYLYTSTHYTTDTSVVRRVALTGDYTDIVSSSGGWGGTIFQGRDRDLRVTGFGSGTISRVTRAGVRTVIASGLSQPYQTIEASDLNFYTTIYASNLVKKTTPGGVISTFVTDIVRASGIIQAPEGYLYVVGTGAADGNPNTVDGTIWRVTLSGTKTLVASNLQAPAYIVRGADGNYYTGSAIAGPSDGALWKYSETDGVSVLTTGLGVVNDLIAGPDGNLYIGDATNGGRVWRVALDGTKSIVLSGIGAPGGFALAGSYGVYVIAGDTADSKTIRNVPIA